MPWLMLLLAQPLVLGLRRAQSSWHLPSPASLIPAEQAGGFQSFVASTGAEMRPEKLQEDDFLISQSTFTGTN